jgi:hypothetical protein
MQMLKSMLLVGIPPFGLLLGCENIKKKLMQLADCLNVCRCDVGEFNGRKCHPQFAVNALPERSFSPPSIALI